MDGWRPWASRESEPEQRVHENLTEKARGRLKFALTQPVTAIDISSAYKQYRTEVGYHVDYFNIEDKISAKNSLGKFISEEPDENVLTIAEILLNDLLNEDSLINGPHTVQEVIDLHIKIDNILTEEGILLKLRTDLDDLRIYKEKVLEYRSKMEHIHPSSLPEWPEKQFNIQFERLAHSSVIESDQQVRKLGKTERWKDVLNPYNDAWEAYQNPPVTYVVAEKLYNSLEMTLVKICVEEQGWNDGDDGVSAHIESLKGNGLFEPNNAMVYEWTQIVEGIKTGVQRTGADRKRHEEFDEDYALLLLHQVGAFLSFIINRYEDEYVD